MSLGAGGIHGRFLAQVELRPEAPAVRAGEQTLSYAELARRSAAVAGGLAAAGVGRGDRVAITLGRGLDMVVAVLGVLRAGAAYVPIDPDYPPQRVAMMLEGAAPAAILSEAGVVLPTAVLPTAVLPTAVLPTAVLPTGSSAPVLRVAELVAADAPASAVAVGPRDAAYAMFTSGSSGRPKCAVTLHQGVVNLVEHMARSPGLAAGDVVAQVISLSHDMSVADIFLALSVGACVRVLPAGAGGDAELLAQELARDPATYVSATPSSFRLLVDRGWQPLAPLTVLMAGEALPPDLVAPLVARGCTVWNGYGMTEASVYTTITRCQPGQPVTIGGRVAGTPVYLLDEALHPVAEGEVGELYQGGVGVGTGYLGRPEQTAARFLPDPFAGPAGGAEVGATMYRSGDLARATPEGDLVYLGRADRQVKIRGFRVELGEVEARLTAHPEVGVALVGARPGPDGAARLVAWVVPAELTEGPASERSTVGLATALRTFVAATLPAWMVPARFVLMQALPCTPMGKLDRDALPDPGPERDPELGEATPPRGPVEAAVAEAMAQVLGLFEVGRDDDFFALGGDSLAAARVAFRVERALGCAVPTRTLFAQRSVAALAQALDAAVAAAPLPVLPADAPAPLSATQRRLWFQQQLQPERVDTNISVIFHLDGPLEVRDLQAALATVFARQQALRTVFRSGPEGPTQVLLSGPPRLAVSALDHLAGDAAEDAIEAEALEQARALFRQPFDLERGPVARVALLRLGPTRHRLLWSIHHIAVDGWSIPVLREELVAALVAQAGGPVPPRCGSRSATTRPGRRIGSRGRGSTPCGAGGARPSPTRPRRSRCRPMGRRLLRPPPHRPPPRPTPPSPTSPCPQPWWRGSTPWPAARAPPPSSSCSPASPPCCTARRGSRSWRWAPWSPAGSAPSWSTWSASSPTPWSCGCRPRRPAASRPWSRLCAT